MSKNLLIVLFFLTLFSHHHVLLALTLNEELNTQILKIYPQDIVALNRGAEDGVVEQDHIKLMNGGTFIGRGLCFKTTKKNSYWKFYRVQNAKKLNLQDSYKLISINLSDVRPVILKEVALQKMDFKGELLPDSTNEQPQ